MTLFAGNAQRTSLFRILNVNIGIGVQEKIDQLLIVLTDCYMKGSSVLVIGCVDECHACQRFNHVGVAALYSDMKCSLAIPIPCQINLRLHFPAELNNITVPIFRCQM